MTAGLSQEQICGCFNRLFQARYRVRLLGGGAEPEYLPPGTDSSQLGRLIAREDFAASALHEAAHWCVAGAARRALPDYGYIYLPPPRSAIDQVLFFANELRNQAVELYLAEAAGVSFRASADDPELGLTELATFEAKVRATVEEWWTKPAIRTDRPPPRAVAFAAALAETLAANHG